MKHHRLLGFIALKVIKKLVHTVIFIRFYSGSFKKDVNNVQIIPFTVCQHFGELFCYFIHTGK